MSDFQSGVYQLHQVPKLGTEGKRTYIATSGQVESKEQLDAWFSTEAAKVVLPVNSNWTYAAQGSSEWMDEIPGSPFPSQLPVRELGESSDPELLRNKDPESLEGRTQDAVKNTDVPKKVKKTPTGSDANGARANWEKQIAMKRYLKSVEEKQQLAQAVTQLIKKQG